MPILTDLSPDYSSYEIDLNGQIFGGVREVSYTQTLEPGVVRGTRAEKIARTRGEYNAEGSMVMYRIPYDTLIAALSAVRSDQGYMEVSFNITATVERGDGTLHVTRLIGCRITSEEGGGSEGSDPLEVSVDLDIMRVEHQRPAGDIGFPLANQLI